MDIEAHRLLRETERVEDLRHRVRLAMEQPPIRWECPPRIPDYHLGESLAVRKARAIALKLGCMPTDLWQGQLSEVDDEAGW